MKKLLYAVLIIAISLTGIIAQDKEPYPEIFELPEGVTTGITTYDEYILQAAQIYDLDPLLLIAQMKQESSNKSHAVSPKGAKGLMQLMPDTAKRFGVKNIYSPKQNIFAGAKYMRWLINRFGDVKLALAGYNAGEGTVEKYGRQIPPYRETQAYVAKIMAHYDGLSAMREQQIKSSVTETAVLP